MFQPFMIIQSRKNDHIRICTEEQVEHGGSTLLEEVLLVHEALPETSFDEIDLSSRFLGKALSAPVVIGSMTGGSEEAGQINRHLAWVAQKHGLAIGLGSQRAMWVDPGLASTYHLRDLAPDVPLLANLGVVQARDIGIQGVKELVDAVDADALCIHLNPAQELAQTEGDRNFQGCLSTLGSLVRDLGKPVIVKETGCGLGPATLDRLVQEGIRYIEVSGSGGTSWTRVEAFRNHDSVNLGQLLADWGIPTAASIAFAARRGLSVTASGGIRDALDIARSLALGADRVAMALPFLRTLQAEGPEGLDRFTGGLISALRAVLLLTGIREISEVRGLPRVLGPSLRAWLELDSGRR